MSKLRSAIGWLLWPLLVATATASQPQVPRALDLAADAAWAEERGLVLLLLVSQEHCGFCDLLKREQLQPMLKNTQYAERVLIRELWIDPGESLRDFAGRSLAGADLASRYGVFVTPTLLFLGPDGRELSKRMVGINTPEMFGWYLDQAIEQARQALVQPAPARPETATSKGGQPAAPAWFLH